MATPETSILSVTQVVSDQEEALAFYRDALGFEVRRDARIGADVRWIEVAPPGSRTTIALIRAGSGVPQGVRIGVAHIDLARDTLQRDEVDVDDAVIRTPYAPPMFTARDPDGNTVVFVEAPDGDGPG